MRNNPDVWSKTQTAFPKCNPSQRHINVILQLRLGVIQPRREIGCKLRLRWNVDTKFTPCRVC